MGKKRFWYIGKVGSHHDRRGMRKYANICYRDDSWNGKMVL